MHIPSFMDGSNAHLYPDDDAETDVLPNQIMVPPSLSKLSLQLCSKKIVKTALAISMIIGGLFVLIGLVGMQLNGGVGQHLHLISNWWRQSALPYLQNTHVNFKLFQLSLLHIIGYGIAASIALTTLGIGAYSHAKSRFRDRDKPYRDLNLNF